METPLRLLAAVGISIFVTVSGLGVEEKIGDIDFECPEGWRFWGPSCYWMVDTPMDWADSVDMCESFLASPLEVKDEIENAEMAKWARVASWSSKFWVFRDKRDACHGYWDNDQPPSDFNPETSCSAIDTEGLWSVVPCQSRLPFFCTKRACIKGTFDCGNGRCINQDWRCDGNDDCGNNMDEMECTQAPMCAYRYTDPAVPINYFNYGSNLDCTFTIVGAPDTRIVGTFTSFRLEQDADYVHVYVGSQVLGDAKLLIGLTGNKDGQKVYSTNHIMILRLSSDSNIQDSGFSFGWIINDPELSTEIRYVTAEAVPETLTTPYFPSTPPSGFRREWMVMAEDSLISVQIDPPDLVPEWSLVIYDGQGYGDIMLQATSAADLASPSVYISTTSSVRIIVIGRDTSEGGSGITMQVKKGCEVRVSRESGMIKSPGYARNTYPNSVTCSWRLEAPLYARRNFSIVFLDLNLVDDGADYIEVFDGADSTSSVSYKYTGQVQPAPTVQTGTVAFISFPSSLIRNMGKFRFQFSVDCPEIPASSNMILSTSDRSYQSVVVLTCDAGYSFTQQEYYLNPSVTFTCQLGGTWDRLRYPTCSTIYCGAAPAIENGRLTNTSGAVTFGSTAKYECYVGFTMQNSAEVTCLGNGKWSTPPNCISSTCPRVPFVSNANNNIITEGDSTSYGAVVEYTCVEGYEIIGVPRRQCQRNDTWSGSAPTCRKIKCPLPMIKNGVLGSIVALSFQDNLRVTCNDGYWASTNNRTFDQLPCRANGTFEELMCVDENECERSVPVCLSTESCINTEGSYQCPCLSGYIKNGDVCVDIDECGDDTHGCQGTCRNTPTGKYSCFCDAGYAIFDNGTSGFHVAPGESGTRPGDTYRIDHTCVRVSCPRPPDLQNGFIHSARTQFLYQEKLIFSCKLGYVLSGSRERTCQASTTWSGSTPVCSAATCVGQSRAGSAAQQLAVNRIIPGTAVGFGDKVYIECKRPDESFYNMTRFCAYDRVTDTYRLQGEGPECQVVDCGRIPDIPGLARPAAQATTYGQSFTFNCQTGASRSGISSQSNNLVTCMDTGRWGLGTLTCSAAKCPDPGTRAGTSQTYDSYEQGQTVHYTCTEAGFTLAPAAANLTCVYSSISGRAEWDRGAPTCRDTTKPVFPSCPERQTMSINKMAQPGFTRPGATDNSGLVTEYTVNPIGFDSTDPMWKDTIVTYTARDGEGNEETCVYSITMNDYTPGTLDCPAVITIEATDTATTYNITDELNFSGGQLTSFPQITVTLSDVGSSLDYRVTLRTDVGRETTCAFKVEVVSGGCYPSLLPDVNNAVRQINEGSLPLAATVTCADGYAFSSGRTEMIYYCSGKNVWSPPLPMDSCIEYFAPEFKYPVALTLISNVRFLDDEVCRTEFNTIYSEWLSRPNSLINQACDNGQTPPLKYNFRVTDAQVTGDRRHLIHTVGLKLELLNNDGSSTALQQCEDYINTNKMTLFEKKEGTCQFDVSNTATAAVHDAGNSCQTGFTLRTVGDGQQCFPCPLGTYTDSTGQCVECPNGEYQDEAGRGNCKPCGSNKFSKTPRISVEQCGDKCNIGFFSANGESPCAPCPVDKYWVSSDTCESCPNGGSTLNVEGATSVTQCREPCPKGQYSPTGYSPCQVCPRNFYQHLTGQTQCLECNSDAITASVGSTLATDCQTIDTDCTAICDQTGGVCSTNFHRRLCTCRTGYEGPRCAFLINHCDSNPCFNSGQCTSTLDGYTCTCPSSRVCSMTLTADKFKEQFTAILDQGSGWTLATCQARCVSLSTCQAIMFSPGDASKVSFCQLLSAKPGDNQRESGSDFDYYRKDCAVTFFYEGSRCEIDRDNDCESNDCSEEAVCRDLINGFECVCPLGDIYFQPRCERDQDPCIPTPCVNDGICNKREDIRYQCTCLPGYTGTNCETEIDECDHHPDGCLYGGGCLEQVNGYRCDCPVGFLGSNCESVADYCAGSACNNGICLNNYINLTAECVCEHPFEKDSNGICSRITFCETAMCHENNTQRCDNLADTYRCVCKTGFEGFLCQHEVDNCVRNDCEQGTCVDGENTYTCACHPGWMGPLCDLDILDCSGKCLSNGALTCEDLTNDYRCICRPGFTGKDCENDIDECASLPCHHDSECVNGNADYTCNCEPGWTGRNCEALIDQCELLSLSCLNDGRCLSLATYAFCLCKTGISGDRCDVSSQLCSLQPPCTSQGTCRQIGGTAQCECSENYSGVSCELIKDHCSEDTCKNGGICKRSDPRGFSCDCADGFTGPTCETRPSICSSCPSDTICRSDGENDFCSCAPHEILTGNICKTVSSSFDLYLNPELGPSGATSTTAFRLSEGDMTVMFWIGFISGARTVYISDVEDKTQYFEFYPNKVKLAAGGEEEEVYFERGTLNTVLDKWDHVAFAWHLNGNYEVFINNVQTAEGTTNFNLTVDDRWKLVRIDSTFTGYVSQLTVWRGVLTRDEIREHINNINKKPDLGRLATGWKQFTLSPGSRRFVPTTAGLGVSLFAEGRPKHEDSEDKSLPKIFDCPSTDRIKQISERTIEVIDAFTLPNSGDNTVTSTLTDELLMAGRYDIVYAAKNQRGNYATCRFKVYIRAYDLCTLDGFSPTVSSCGSRSIKEFCADNKLPSVPFPNILTCGIVGLDDVSNPKEPIVRPICGDKNNQKFSAKMKLTYHLGTECGDFVARSIKTALEKKFITDVKQQWPNLCDDTCTNMAIVPVCDDVNIIVTITFITLEAMIANKDNSLSLTPKEILRLIAIETPILDLPEYGALQKDRRQVEVELLPSCDNLQAISGRYCVTCGPGSFFNSTSSLCQLCPVGSYTDVSSQTTCTSCGDKTTLAIGSRRLSDCIEKCKAGQQYKNERCSDCPSDYYQMLEGKAYCDTCPLGKRTQGTGTTTASNCFDDCDSGTELLEDGTCRECPQGFYRTQSIHTKCIQCTGGNTTEGPRTTSSSGCFLPPCESGSFINENRECLSCPRGKHQALKWQRTCDDCPTSYTTENDGADNATLCRFVCPPGQQEVSPGSTTCSPCPAGTYRDSSLAQRFLQCQNCPSDFTTDGTGASDKERDCVIRVCYAGTKRNEENECEQCPIGEYQPEDLQTTCRSCGARYTTETVGSINGTTACKFYCPDGEEILSAADETCRPCPRGKFRSKTDALRFFPCQSCGEVFTTDAEGAMLPEDCNIKICPAGQIVSSDKLSCDDCPADTYQPEDLPSSTTECIPCGLKKGTRQSKSTEMSQCLPWCPTGQQVAGDECELCPQGTWNDGSAQRRFDPCIACSDVDYTTPNRGSMSALACSLRNCDPGYKIKDPNLCEPCGYGNYQPNRASASCIECGTDQNTSTATAQSREQCTVSCPPGKQGNQEEGVCTKCPPDTWKPSIGFAICEPCPGDRTSDDDRVSCTLLFCDKGNGYNSEAGTCSACVKGFYKEGRGNSPCVACPKNYTTAGEGTASATGCSQLHCEPGLYAFMTEVCTPCPVGYFKSEVGAQNCTMCSADKTTAAEGATREDQCTLAVCPVGKYRTDTNVCNNCPRGTFQSEMGAVSCESCGDRYTTAEEGSTMRDECLVVCNRGAYRSTPTLCTSCEKGKYQPNSGATTCEDCTTGFTTETTGSERESQCFRQCPAGQFRPPSDRTSCNDCPFGKYQANVGQTDCDSCGINFSTLQVASTNANQCMPECASGKYLNASARMCDECPLGTYQSVSGTTIQECTPCPTGKTTSSRGSTVRANCNLDDCEAGYFRETGTGCQVCGQGKYQPLKAQTQCEDCGSGKTTRLGVTTATSASECIPDCPNGKQLNDFTNLCEDCDFGKIRDKTKADYCYKCPPGTSTNRRGALECIVAPTPTFGLLARIRLVLTMSFTVNSCGNSDLVEFTIRSSILFRIRRRAERFPRLCIGTCSNFRITFVTPCGSGTRRRRKRATTVEAEIEATNLDQDISDTASSITRDPKSLLVEALADTKDVEDDLAAAGITNPTLVSAVENVVCLDGAVKEAATDLCVPCAVGKFHNTTADQCQVCSINSYQDQAGRTSCTPCQATYSTRMTGSSAASACLAPCAINNDYCQNGGVCLNGVCDCTEFYTGDSCSTRQTVESNLQWIIIGVCAGIFVLLVSILVIGYFCCRKAPREKAPQDRHSMHSPSTGYPDYMQSPFVRGDYMAQQGYVQYPNPNYNDAYDFYKSGRGMDR